MAFINKQEEVMQIKLTQFGKRQLAKGKFKPVFYAFFDDDIIYDISHASISEHQNETESRIKETLRLGLIHSTLSLEERYEHETRELLEEGNGPYRTMKTRQPPRENNRLLSCILGHINKQDQAAPSFTIHSRLGAGFEGDVTYQKETSTRSTPQINSSITYEVKAVDVSTRIPVSDFETEIDLTSREIEFLDGTSLVIDGDKLVLQIDELGVTFEKDMFELELYEIEDLEEGKLVAIEEPEKLFSIKKDRNIDNYKEVAKEANKGLFNKG